MCCVSQLDAHSTVPLTDLPSPPRTPSYTVQQYGRDNVSLTVQWQSPQDDGGAPVNNYTVTVSPGSIQVITTVTSASLPAVPYNVMHNVSIVATNCNGRSIAVMETIRVGRLYQSLEVFYMWRYYLLNGHS